MEAFTFCSKNHQNRLYRGTLQYSELYCWPLEAEIPMTSFLQCCHNGMPRLDIPPCQIIQTQGRPVVMFSVKAECQAGYHNQPVYLSGVTQPRNQARITTHEA